MIVQAGSTDVTTYFVLRTAADGTATTGATITNIDLTYCRSGAAPAAKVDATALATTDAAHADNKAIEVDATNQPGLYRVDWPDAAFAAGVREVILTVKLASSFTEHLRVELSPAVDMQAVDGDETAAANLKSACGNYSATRGLAGTALPPAAADAAGGLPISDAGGLDLDSKLANTNEVTAARMGALTDWINGGRLDLILDAILDDTDLIDDATSGLAKIATDAAAILVNTAVIGAAGAGLTEAGGTGDHLTALAQASVCTEARLAELDAGTAGKAANQIDEIRTDSENIQSRLPAALVSGRMSSDAVAIGGSTDAADRLAASAKTIVTGAAEAGTLSTTQMTSDLAEATNDHYIGRIVIWTSGVLKDQASDITDYAGATGLLTFSAVTEAPSAGDTFVIV